MVATIDNQMQFESYVNKNYTFNPLGFEGIKVIIDSKQKFLCYGKFYKFATDIFQ